MTIELSNMEPATAADIKLAFSPFLGAMMQEMQRAQLDFPPMHSLHEAYAILKEEVDEFWDEVKLKPALRNQDALIKELVQVATMAWRTVYDLYEAKPAHPAEYE